MYRPEGFYETISKSPFAQEARDSVAFVEFIADAMLKGLQPYFNKVRKMCEDVSPIIDAFIPEEKR